MSNTRGASIEYFALFSSLPRLLLLRDNSIRLPISTILSGPFVHFYRPASFSLSFAFTWHGNRSPSEIWNSIQVTPPKTRIAHTVPLPYRLPILALVIPACQAPVRRPILIFIRSLLTALPVKPPVLVWELRSPQSGGFR